MLQAYIELLKNLLEGMKSGGEAATFGQLLEAVGCGIGLILCVVLSIGVLVAICYGPVFLYKKLFVRLNNKIKELMSADKIDRPVLIALEKKKKLFIGLYIFVAITIYMPTAIPIVLFIFDKIANLF